MWLKNCCLSFQNNYAFSSWGVVGETGQSFCPARRGRGQDRNEPDFWTASEDLGARGRLSPPIPLLYLTLTFLS